LKARPDSIIVAVVGTHEHDEENYCTARKNITSKKRRTFVIIQIRINTRRVIISKNSNSMLI